MATYGKTDWADNKRSNTNKIDYKEKFVKLTDGNKKVLTLVRIVSDLYKYANHKVFFPGDVGNGAKYGRNIRCALENCPLCLEGNQAKEEYYMAVIVRKTKELKYVTAKWSLKNAIMKIKDSPTFADEVEEIKPTDCDVQIIADPAQGATGFYTVLPANKKPLSAQDLQLIESVDFDSELDKMCVPPTAEEVSQSIERIKKWIAKNSKAETTTTEEEEEAPAPAPVQKAHKASKKEEVKEEASTESADEDFDFRSVKR